MSEISILSYTIRKHVMQAENAVTDCLCFILRTHSSAARAFTRYLCQTSVELPDILELNTQVSWEHGGRPDLIGLHNKNRVLLIESKFGAPLTKNQPIGYLGQLAPQSDGVLLFIAPALRVEGLWEELKEHCLALKIDISTQKRTTKNGLITAHVSNNHYLALTSWECLVAYLIEDLSSKHEQMALEDLRQFKAVCDRLGSGNLEPFPFSQVASDGDKRDRQLRTMVDSLTKALVDGGFAKTKGYRATPGPGYYKRYMTLSCHINWCVEFNHEYWARFGESLIWLTVTTAPEIEVALKPLEINLSGLSRRYGNQFILPLKSSHSRSEADALDHMTKQAISIAKALVLPTE